MKTVTCSKPFLAAALMVLFYVAAVAAQDTKPVYALHADGLACPFCAYGIEKHVRAIDGVEAVETDLKTCTVRITMRPGATLDEATVKKAVQAAGFTMRGFERAEAAK